mgnify:CR=1 FL=1
MEWIEANAGWLWLVLAAVVVMYLVLGILYESAIHPITILSTLPSATVGALLALLVIVVVKFNARANPVPSKTTHNTLIEVAWTLIPVLILVGIAVPSFRLLFLELDVPKPDLTVKVTGKQWYWSYAYPDNGKFEFDSLLDKDKQPRLLGVDNEMVVPVNKVVRIQTTGADVIHSWWVPALAVKKDAIPGFVNESWTRIEEPGIYRGQCTELCGKDHGFMPIVVRAVPRAEFDQWLAAQRGDADAAANIAHVAATAADPWAAATASSATPVRWPSRRCSSTRSARTSTKSSVSLKAPRSSVCARPWSVRLPRAVQV